MGTVYNFPSKFIFHKQVPGHSLLKKKLYTAIMKEIRAKEREYLNDHDKWDCKVITSYFDGDGGQMFNQFPEFRAEIWIAMDEMVSQVRLNSIPERSLLSKIWYNVYKKGYNQEVHQHMGSDFSGIYILHATEPNKTVFYSEENHLLLNKTLTTEEFKEGTLILFPSHLSHYVNPIQDKLRITISFNINCTL